MRFLAPIAALALLGCLPGPPEVEDPGPPVDFRELCAERWGARTCTGWDCSPIEGVPDIADAFRSAYATRSGWSLAQVDAQVELYRVEEDDFGWLRITGLATVDWATYPISASIYAPASLGPAELRAELRSRLAFPELVAEGLFYRSPNEVRTAVAACEQVLDVRFDAEEFWCSLWVQDNSFRASEPISTYDQATVEVPVGVDPASCTTWTTMSHCDPGEYCYR